MRLLFLRKLSSVSLFLLLFSAVAVISLGASLLKPAVTNAVDGSDFRAGRIIDDVVFYNSNAMNASEIQAFLNAKMPECDTQGAKTAGGAPWYRPDISRATLASYIRNGTNGYDQNTSFHAPPYTCMRNFKQNTPQVEAASGYCSAIPERTNRTAAGIIEDVAKACGINPQVLLVLLQKEQSLVTDDWPLNLQYQRATGFDCPDNAGGACNPAYNGFFRQVYSAARQFKVYQANPNSYNYRAGQTNNIFWQTNGGNFETNGTAASRQNGQCGYSRVYIENQATAALYIYTPYRPNSAALNSYPGTGDACSAYGNRNFWFLFSGWFGSPIRPGEVAIANRYKNLPPSTKTNLGSATSNVKCGLKDDGCYQRYENGAILWSPSTGAWESLGSIRKYWTSTGYENGSLGYPTSGEIRLASTGGWYQRYQNGYIIGKGSTGYWESKGSIRNRWAQLGYEGGSLGYPTGPEVIVPTGGWQQAYEHGTIFGRGSTGYWESKGSIRNRWAQLGYEGGSLGYPTGPEVIVPTGGWQQAYEHGTIFGRGSTGYWESSNVILDRYKNLGGGSGKLGYPISGTKCGLIQDGCYQSYQKGVILWTEATGAWESLGSIRAFWITTGWESGSLGYPIGGEVQDPTGAWSQKYEKGTVHSKKGVSSAV